MLSQIIQLIIIVVFLLLSGHYLFVNSLRKKTFRKDSLKAAGAALYFLPVFMQGVFLFCAGVLYCFFLTRDFFYLLQFLFFKGYGEAPGFRGLLIIFPGVMLMGVNCYLAKQSFNNDWNAKAVSRKVLYVVFSMLMVKLMSYHFPSFFLTAFYPLDNSEQPYISGSFVFITWALLLLAALIIKKENRFTLYLKIPLLTITLYACFCFGVALVCRSLLSIFSLLHL